MTHARLRLALGALAFGLATPALALTTFDDPTPVVDDVPDDKKDKKKKTTTVWILEAKGSS